MCIRDRRQGAAEALMLNDLGNVADCTGDNIFIVKDGTVFTPPVTDGCLDGITRRVVPVSYTHLDVYKRQH